MNSKITSSYELYAPTSDTIGFLHPFSCHADRAYLFITERDCVAFFHVTRRSFRALKGTEDTLDDNLKAKTPVITQLVKAVGRSVDNTGLDGYSRCDTPTRDTRLGMGLL